MLPNISPKFARNFLARFGSGWFFDPSFVYNFSRADFFVQIAVSRRTILEIRQIFMLKAKNAKTGAASIKSWSPEGRQF